MALYFQTLSVLTFLLLDLVTIEVGCGLTNGPTLLAIYVEVVICMQKYVVRSKLPCRDVLQKT